MDWTLTSVQLTAVITDCMAEIEEKQKHSKTISGQCSTHISGTIIIIIIIINNKNKNEIKNILNIYLQIEAE